MNKKASLLDLIYIILVLFVFSLVVLIGLKMANSFNSNIQGMSSTIIDDTTKQTLNEVETKYTYSIDNAYLILLIFMCISMLILAAMVAVHPIFIPIYFIGWIFTIILGGIFSNVYQKMAEASDLAATASSLSFVSFIMQYMPIIVGVFGVVLMVIMYKVSNQ